MTGSHHELSREDFNLKKSKEGPVLEVAGKRLLLKTVLTDEVVGFSSAAENIRTEVDSDGANGAWWMVYPDDDLQPMLEIIPEVLPDDDAE